MPIPKTRQRMRPCRIAPSPARHPPRLFHRPNSTQKPDQSSNGPAAAAPAAPVAAPAASAPVPAPTAAAPADTSAPAATVAASPDAPIADQLHNLASGKFDQIIGNKQIRSQVRLVLFRPQLRADLDHRRQSQCARDSSHRLSRPRRRRRARSRRLSGAELRGDHRSGGARQCRNPADHVGHHLCASRCRRARALVARNRGHLNTMKKRRIRPMFWPASSAQATSPRRSTPTSRKRRAISR